MPGHPTFCQRSMNNLAVEPRTKLLPAGRHQADLETIYKVFVENAPNRKKREQIFGAFTAWIEEINAVLPEHLLWVNGGFVTYKEKPPKDIDVVIITKKVHIEAFPADRVTDLLTQNGPPRIQPMAKLVDAHLSANSTSAKLYWIDLWGRVLIPGTQDRLVGQEKGFVEVVI